MQLLIQLLIQLKAYQITQNTNQRHVPSRSSLTTGKKKSAATFTEKRFPSDSIRSQTSGFPLGDAACRSGPFRSCRVAGSFWRWNPSRSTIKGPDPGESTSALVASLLIKGQQCFQAANHDTTIDLLHLLHHHHLLHLPFCFSATSQRAILGIEPRTSYAPFCFVRYLFSDRSSSAGADW